MCFNGLLKEKVSLTVGDWIRYACLAANPLLSAFAEMATDMESITAMMPSNRKTDTGFQLPYLDLTLALFKGQGLGNARSNEIGICTVDLLKMRRVTLIHSDAMILQSKMYIN